MNVCLNKQYTGLEKKAEMSTSKLKQQLFLYNVKYASIGYIEGLQIYFFSFPFFDKLKLDDVSLMSLKILASKILHRDNRLKHRTLYCL